MNRLKDILNMKSVSVNAFAKTLAMSPRTLYNKINKGHWTEAEICAVCVALDLRFEEVEDFMTEDYKKMLLGKMLKLRP